jgi:hypothetical protein
MIATRNRIAMATTTAITMARSAGLLNARTPCVSDACAVEVGRLLAVDNANVGATVPDAAVGAIEEARVAIVVATCFRLVQSSFTPLPSLKYRSID